MRRQAVFCPPRLEVLYQVGAATHFNSCGPDHLYCSSVDSGDVGDCVAGGVFHCYDRDAFQHPLQLIFEAFPAAVGALLRPVGAVRALFYSVHQGHGPTLLGDEHEPAPADDARARAVWLGYRVQALEVIEQPSVEFSSGQIFLHFVYIQFHDSPRLLRAYRLCKCLDVLECGIQAPSDHGAGTRTSYDNLKTCFWLS